MTTMASGQAYRTRLRYSENTGPLYVADKYAPILIGSVLDVGCGEGLLRKLVHQPFRYIGVDSRADADERVEVGKEPLPFADLRFDTVVCAGALARVGNPEWTMGELCRVARGRVIVGVPGETSEVVGRSSREQGFVTEQVDEEGGVAWWVLKRGG